MILLNKFYSFCMVAVVVIISKRGINIDAHHGNQPNKNKLVLFKALIHINSHLNPLLRKYIHKNKGHFSYKNGCGVCGHIVL